MNNAVSPNNTAAEAGLRYNGMSACSNMVNLQEDLELFSLRRRLFDLPASLLMNHRHDVGILRHDVLDCKQKKAKEKIELLERNSGSGS